MTEQDLEQLMRGNRSVQLFVPRAIQLMKTSTDQLKRLSDLGDEVSPEPDDCVCSDPETVLHLLWFGGTGAEWVDFPAVEEEAELIRDLAAASAPRSDVLSLGKKVIALDPPGFFDALLVLAATRSNDRTNSKWHESSIADEARKSWTRPDRIFVNVPWVSDPERLRNQAPGERHHDGELDIAVVKDGVFFDLQAKSARSVDYVKRERLPARAALEQHQNLRSSAATGVWTVLSGPDRSIADTLRSDQPLVIGPGHLVHIPMSVGTEEVHAWAVGASLFDDPAFPRVMTTLDHMRLINEYVPAHFREVYWIDRYTQEFGQARFINEMDYLEKWHSLLRSEGGVHSAVGPNHLVLASDGPIESDVITRNTEHGSGLRPGDLPNPGRVHLSKAGPETKTPKLDRILRTVVQERVVGAVGLLRLVLGSNVALAEDAVAERRNKLFDGTLGKWGLIHRAPGRSSFESSNADVVLYSDCRWKVWRIWERTPWQTQLWNLPDAPIKVRFAVKPAENS